MWAGWLTVSLLAAIASLSIMLSVLLSPSARAATFNLYLVALSIPDFVISFNCAITCGMNYKAGFYVSEGMCEWQAFYASFGIAGSFWLNALVARELHVLLRRTKALLDYRPPPPLVVARQCALVLLLCSLLSSTHLWDVFPFRAFPTYGIVCVVNDYDVGSSLFTWLVYMPSIAFLPCFYVFYVAYDCWRKRLFSFDDSIRPKELSARSSFRSTEGDSEAGSIIAEMMTRRNERRTRQARALGLYFARIFLALLVMWVPASIFLVLVKFRSPWGVWLGGTWGHLQGLVSALMCLTKSDVREAVIDLYTCRLRRRSVRVSVATTSPAVCSKESERQADLHELSSRSAVLPLPFNGAEQPRGLRGSR